MQEILNYIQTDLISLNMIPNSVAYSKSIVTSKNILNPKYQQSQDLVSYWPIECKFKR